jgi:hypothetical protein
MPYVGSGSGVWFPVRACCYCLDTFVPSCVCGSIQAGSVHHVPAAATLIMDVARRWFCGFTTFPTPRLDLYILHLCVRTFGLPVSEPAATHGCMQPLRCSRSHTHCPLLFRLPLPLRLFVGSVVLTVGYAHGYGCRWFFGLLVWFVWVLFASVAYCVL